MDSQPLNNESNGNTHDIVIRDGTSSDKDPRQFITNKSIGIKSEEDLKVEDGQLFMSGVGTTSNDDLKSNEDIKVVSEMNQDYGDDLSNQVGRLNKMKSQNAASQVKITQGTSEIMVDSQQQIMSSQVLGVTLKNQKLESKYTV